MNKRVVVCLLIAVTCLTGCWNYQEIDEIEIVLGLGLDTEYEVNQKPDNQYRLTYEVVGIESKEGQLESKASEDIGDTVFQAIRKIIEKNGKRAYLSHIKVLVISEKLAMKGITEILDYTMRDAEYRPDVNILVSNNADAGQLFLKKPKDTVVSMVLNDALQNQKKIGTFESTTVWNVIEKISKKGFEPAIPLVNMEEVDGEQTHRISGTAVFKGANMVGKLTAKQTLYYLFIDNEIGNQPLSMEYSFGENQRLGHVSLEILKNSTKMTPVVDGDSLLMKIDVKCEVAISELSSTDFDILSEKDRKDLEDAAAEEITEGINQVIEHVQKEYNSDIFGFGDLIKRNRNKVWKKIEDDWDVLFPTLPVDIQVDVKIKRSALSAEPIKIDEF
ncbi:Ger(x)C family spore germination protein [Vallitalea pronyensis]|uniref:Ger(X)C family spore germination protein n=1 Tax=Vallitalea pronyensis TaxID=1348613 RepID=A0A8J8SIB4_9FIRM|nr:Ger(x)C family spore germination protein [Vallitalea pronyensis]QUI24416.1 Ger(x)C family spore germination protein [Vallitalea pronyensis]